MRLAGPEFHLYGVAVARVLVGAAGVHHYLSNYAHRAFMFGPRSYLAGARAGDGIPGLYDLTTGPIAFDVAYHAGLLAAFAFAVFGGRALALAHAVFFWSLHARNPALFDGGDAFGRIAAVIMILAVTNAYLSPGARRQRRERHVGQVRWTSLLHNCAVVMLIIQIAIVYISAGLFKAMDPLWQAGTALHRIAQLEDYRFVDWVGVVSNPAAVTIASYATVALELAFPFALATRLRRPVIVSLATMHAVLAVLMGLVGFALHMWAGLAVCLRDTDWPRLLDTDKEGVARLSASVDLDLHAEALTDPLPELVRVPLVDVGTVDERHE